MKQTWGKIKNLKVYFGVSINEINFKMDENLLSERVSLPGYLPYEENNDLRKAFKEV